MNLLLFNMSNYVDWENGVVNRNYFIARELQKRPEIDKIFMVDFLAIQSRAKVFGKKRTWQYAKQVIHCQDPVDSLGMFNCIRKIGDKAYLLQGIGLGHSVDGLLKKVMDFVKEQGFTADNTMLWSYNPFLPEVFDLPAKIKVFDTVDNWAEHASYQKEAELLKRNYKAIDDKADLVFTVSKGLLDMFSRAKAIWIPNGVDSSQFAEVKRPRNEKPVIGYVGTIQKRLDFSWLTYLCSRHTDKKFVFIGPVWSGVEKEAEQLKAKCSNVEFLGRKNYDELPRLFSGIDVAIIPHKLDAFLATTNPMKMYDYLSAGLPVVTTPGAGTDMFSDYLYICEDKEQFSRAIDLALKEDSPDKVQARREAVKNHNWQARAEAMISELKSANMK